MTTQTGDNTHVIAIDGNFDDAQTNVKHMFNDVALREKLAANKLQFSSANSMNIGRLVPQIVYYIYAYAQLVKTGEIKAGDKVNFTVPTGNFGNILAAFYAKQIGLPVGKLICAGLTGGSTPDGNDYDRDIVIVNTMRLNIIQPIKVVLRSARFCIKPS